MYVPINPRKRSVHVNHPCIWHYMEGITSSNATELQNRPYGNSPSPAYKDQWEHRTEKNDGGGVEQNRSPFLKPVKTSLQSTMQMADSKHMRIREVNFREEYPWKTQEMSSNISPFGKAGAVDVAFDKLQIAASENNSGCGFWKATNCSFWK